MNFSCLLEVASQAEAVFFKYGQVNMASLDTNLAQKFHPKAFIV